MLNSKGCVRIKGGICHACPICYIQLSKLQKIYLRIRYKIRWLPVIQ